MGKEEKTKKKEAPPKEPPKEAPKEGAPPPEANPSSSIIEEYSEDQIEDVRECFQLFDKAGTNSIPSTIVIDLLRSLGLNPLEREVEKVIKVEGLTGKQVVFEKFFAIFHHFNTSINDVNERDVLEVFATVADANGAVFKYSVMNLMTLLGEKMDLEKVEALVDPYVNKADGSVDVTPWVYTLLGKEVPGAKGKEDKEDKKKEKKKK